MTLQGFDVSHFQPPLTAPFVHHLMTDDGYSFGGIKCSEGTYGTDPNFHANRDACRANALPRFVYHEATPQSVGGQVQQIMEATGGILFPRERLVIVLGDFNVPAPLALELAGALTDHGPTKRKPGKVWRPIVTLYANRSNFDSVYGGPAFSKYPKWVAAFPGDGSEFKIPGAVAHQDSDHDPATHGDHDVFNPTYDLPAMVGWFKQ